MKSLLFLMLVAASSAAAVLGAKLPTGYTHTPVGPMRSNCVHAVPSGAEIVEQVDGTVAVLVEGELSSKHSRCVESDVTPILLNEVEQLPHGGHLRRNLQLPADYDGWLEYTAAENANGYDAFTGYFSVPDLPAGKSACNLLRHKPHLPTFHRATRHSISIYWCVAFQGHNALWTKQLTHLTSWP